VSFELAFELSNESILTITAMEPSTGQTVSTSYATRNTPQTARAKVAALEAEGPGLTPQELAATRPAGILGFLKRLFGG
jgi:hypothetical protein